MTFLEIQACPNCRGENITVNKIVTLMDGVRYDGCTCNDCGAIWKFYYKISDCKVEVEQPGDLAKQVKLAAVGPNGECMCAECVQKMNIAQDEFTFDDPAKLASPTKAK